MNWKRAHLVGIGGAGMSALAELLLDRGVAVTGSDRHPSERLRQLSERGVEIHVGPHDGAAVPADVDVVVSSGAISADNPELVRARELGVEHLDYPHALARVMDRGRAVAIAGTHGKTTTTAMIAHALIEVGRDPSFVVGGTFASGSRPSRGGRGGDGDVTLVEACEYRHSFLHLPRSVGAILNVEFDHPDYFDDEEATRRAFRQFADGIPTDGCLVLPAPVVNVLGLEPSDRRWVTVGADRDAMVRLDDATLCPGGSTMSISGRVTSRPIVLRLAGRHMIDNAMVAIGVLHTLGVDADGIARGLESFRGVGRRGEVLYEGPPTLISDYAHHPTELEALAAATRQRFPGRRLVILFQPHQAARTRVFNHRFAEALARFDVALIANIYAARDSDADLQAVSSNLLVDAMIQRGAPARAVGDLTDAPRALRSEARPDDVLLLVGAGDVDGLRHELVATLSGADRRADR